MQRHSLPSDDDVLAGIIGVYDAIQGTNENTTDQSSFRSNRGIQFEYMLSEMRSDNTSDSNIRRY